MKINAAGKNLQHAQALPEIVFDAYFWEILSAFAGENLI